MRRESKQPNHTSGGQLFRADIFEATTCRKELSKVNRIVQRIFSDGKKTCTFCFCFSTKVTILIFFSRSKLFIDAKISYDYYD